jgi:hypothetical protein
MFPKGQRYGRDRVSALSQEANQVAHELAKLAYTTRENRVWEGDLPDFLLPFVTNDVTLFIIM